MRFDDFQRQLDAARPRGPANVVCLARTGSTNAVARAIAAEYLEEGLEVPRALVVAFEQTGGRGRLQRGWSSPPGLGVYASVLTGLDGAKQLQTLPLLVAVALARALGRHLSGPPCRIKWPNDLMVGGRKIGGILIETVAGGRQPTAIIGFGVNHGQHATELPGDAATSLALELDHPPPLGRLVWDLVAGLDAELAHLGEEAYAVAAYRRLSVHAPGDVLRCRVGEEILEGTFRGFGEHGFLRLETAEGERRIAAAEVIEP